MRHARWRHGCRIGRIDGLHSPHGEVRRSSGLHTPHGHHLNPLRHHRNSLRHHWNSLRHHRNLRHHRGDSSVGDLRRHFLVAGKTLLLFDEFALVLFELILLGLNLTLKLPVLVLEENERNIFKKGRSPIQPCFFQRLEVAVPGYQRSLHFYYGTEIFVPQFKYM